MIVFNASFFKKLILFKISSKIIYYHFLQKIMYFEIKDLSMNTFA